MIVCFNIFKWDQDIMKKNLVPPVSTNIWLTCDWISLLIFMLSFKGLNPNEILRHTMSLHYRTLKFFLVSSLGKCALNYLLASEGGICGKFNLINRCLQINDERKVMTSLQIKCEKLFMSITRPGKVEAFGNCLENGFQLSGELKSS